MKNFTRVTFLLIACWLSVAAFIPGRLEKAFEALSIYDYFKAKDLLYKSLKSDSAAAAYGLSVIYSRNDNPFTQLDSAHKYINMAESRWSAVEEKNKIEYELLGVDSLSISAQATKVDSLFYSEVFQNPTLDLWIAFIENHDDHYYRQQAIDNRNKLLFNEAKSINTAAAYLKFAEKYPDAKEQGQAKKLYETRIFEEITADGSVSSYQSFLLAHPKSPYRPQAEQLIYSLSTASGTVEDYDSFIKQNPSNPFVEKAWRQIYAMEVKEINARTIAAFTLNYPNYPFMAELKTEFEMAVIRYYPVTDGDYWGFIDDKGDVAIQLKFEWVEDFQDGIAMAGIAEGTTYIDKSGKEILAERLDDGFGFSNGFAIVEKEGLYGIINRLGQYVVQPSYDDIGESSEGLFYVEKNGLYGYVNELGQEVIPLKYTDALDFHMGVAVVTNDSDQKAIVHIEGDEVTAFEYDWIESFSSFDLPVRFRKDEQFGLIDRGGIEVTDTSYQALGEFSDGLVLAAADDSYGFLNSRGDTVVPFKYTFSKQALAESKFADGHAKVFQGSKVGIVDSTGQKIFPAIFEDVGLYEGVRVPVKKRGKWGYADLEIDLAIPYDYSSAENFRDSVAIVSKAELYGVIDTNGTELIDLAYQELSWTDDTLLLAKDSLFGLISLQADTLVRFEYQDASVIDERVIKFLTEDRRPVYFDYRKKQFLRKEDSLQIE
ncbi:MAG: WG repeat-containing protein [Bacteroidota bacterium]